MGRSRKIALRLALPSVLLLAGCGASDGGEGGRHPDYATALAGSPPPLAALHRQADRLLPGGTDAYERRIAALRGYPIVVNVWASWCEECRQEFPVLQRLAARYGKRVAFLGINSKDSKAFAETFLGEDPVPYPSYEDGDMSTAASIGATRGLPDTAFYNRDGKLAHIKLGAYANSGDLRADVERCALQELCEESG